MGLERWLNGLECMLQKHDKSPNLCWKNYRPPVHCGRIGDRRIAGLAGHKPGSRFSERYIPSLGNKPQNGRPGHLMACSGLHCTHGPHSHSQTHIKNKMMATCNHNLQPQPPES